MKINEQMARELFPKASDEFKKMLINYFGERALAQNITDRIQTFEDACSAINVSYDYLDTVSDLSKGDAAFVKLKIITKALNEEWSPDWNSHMELKYFPYFEMKNDFSSHGVGLNTLTSIVPSCLCFKSKELAEYAAKQFLDIYKDYFTI